MNFYSAIILCGGTWQFRTKVADVVENPARIFYHPMSRSDEVLAPSARVALVSAHGVFIRDISSIWKTLSMAFKVIVAIQYRFNFVSEHESAVVVHWERSLTLFEMNMAM